MAHPARRVAPTGSRGNTYSPQRLRLVLILMTAVTLPVVIGCSVVIYYYLKFNVMVDRRLQGERPTDAGRIDRADRLMFGRPASAEEQATAGEYLSHVRERLQTGGVAVEQQTARAWESFVRVMILTNEFCHVN